MKFSELSIKAKGKAISDYIKGWNETHNEILPERLVYELCMDSENDVSYNKNGEVKNDN